MGQNDDFVQMMLKKSEEKEKPAEPITMLSPQPDGTVFPQKEMSDEDIRAVEEFTKSLQKKIQR